MEDKKSKYISDEYDDEEISDEEFNDKDSIFQRWRDSDGEIEIITPEIAEKRKKIVERQRKERMKTTKRTSN